MRVIGVVICGASLIPALRAIEAQHSLRELDDALVGGKELQDDLRVEMEIIAVQLEGNAHPVAAV